MIIKEANRKVRCDMPNCKNLAEMKLEKNGFFKAVGLFVCKDCMKEMYECLATKIVPKSPGNMLNKKIKLSKEKNFEK